MPSYERVSTANSTVAVLSAAATFEGPPEDVGGFATITVFAKADQASEPGAFMMQHSVDGSVWETQKLATVAAGVVQTHMLPVLARFFRLRYTNGGNPQTDFQLQTIFHTNKASAKEFTADMIVGAEDGSLLVRQTSDPNLDRNSGNIAYQATITQYGRNPTIGTGVFEDVWALGGLYNWLTAPDTLRIAGGGNVNDTAAGTGAQKVTIEGLDPNWLPISETLDTAGVLASVSTSQQFIRMNKAFVPENGTGTYTGDNAGNILVETTGGTPLGCIVANLGQTQLGLYSVPAGVTGYITNIRAIWDGQKSGTMRVFQRPAADDVIAPYSARRLFVEFTNFNGEELIKYESYPKLLEKTDLWASAIADTVAGAAGISFDICLVDN